jgi:heme/copper-type cytochrome/quinol oxidase subunit 3
MGGAFLYLEAQSYLKYIGYGLTLGSSTFGSSYYVLTGTHKAHVAVGMIWMAILAWRIYRREDPSRKGGPGRGRRALLALRGYHLDRDLHPRVPDSVRMAP